MTVLGKMSHQPPHHQPSRHAPRYPTARKSLGFNEMQFNPDASIMTREQVVKLRIRCGQCPTCRGANPTQCFDICRRRYNPLSSTRHPRTVAGIVYNGTCLVCHPEMDPDRQLPAIRSRKSIRNGSRRGAAGSGQQMARIIPLSPADESPPLFSSSLVRGIRPEEGEEHPSPTPSGPRSDRAPPSPLTSFESIPSPRTPPSSPASPTSPLVRSTDTRRGEGFAATRLDSGSPPSWNGHSISQIFAPNLDGTPPPLPLRGDPESSTHPSDDSAGGVVRPPPLSSPELSRDDAAPLRRGEFEDDGGSDDELLPRRPVSLGQLEATPAESVPSGSFCQAPSSSSCSAPSPSGAVENRARGDGSVADRGIAPERSDRRGSAKVREVEELVKALVDQGGDECAIDVIAGAMVDGPRCVRMQEYGVLALSELSGTSSENRGRIVSSSALDALVQGMAVTIADAGAQERGCCALRSLAGEEKCRSSITAAGGGSRIVEAMLEHQGAESVVLVALGALTALSVDADARAYLCEKGAEHAVARAMKLHLGSEKIQLEGCSALSNLVADCTCDGTCVSCTEIDSIAEAMAAHPCSGPLQLSACLALRNYVFMNKKIKEMQHRHLCIYELLEFAALNFPECKSNVDAILEETARRLAS